MKISPLPKKTLAEQIMNENMYINEARNASKEEAEKAAMAAIDTVKELQSLRTQLAAAQLKAKSAMPEELWRGLEKAAALTQPIFYGDLVALNMALEKINAWKKEQNL